MSKADFKIFARNNPDLVQSVSSGKTTWQNLYQLYDIYGENSGVWNEYINNSQRVKEPLNQDSERNEQINPNTSISDVVNMIKNIDLETVQKGVTNLQKTIGLLQDFGLGAASNTNNAMPKSYEARPMYQYFED